MKNKTKGVLMQIPGMLVILIVVIGSFFIKLKNIPVNNGQPITWATPITLLIIGILFFVGLYFSTKSDSIF